MREVIWTEAAEHKLQKYKSEYFTMMETRDFIAHLIYDIESLLVNSVFAKGYKEEYGSLKGMNRIVIRKFKVYYVKRDEKNIIVAVKFSGEKYRNILPRHCNFSLSTSPVFNCILTFPADRQRNMTRM